jgi:hypothetical protein
MENMKQQTWPITQDPDEVLLHRLLPDIKAMNANFVLLILCIFVYLVYLTTNALNKI